MDSEETDGAADSTPPIFGINALSKYISAHARLEENTWTALAEKAYKDIFQSWQSRKEKPA